MNIFFNRFSSLFLLSTSFFCLIPRIDQSEANPRISYQDESHKILPLLLKGENKTQQSISQLLIVQEPIEVEKKKLLDELEQLNQQVIQFSKEKRFSEAIQIAQRALSVSKRALGTEHPKVAMSFNNLGLLYESQGLYSQAAPMYQQGLRTYEISLGTEHPIVATSLTYLVALYHSQGLYTKAEPLAQRALRINEKVFGTEHPNVATSLSYLSVLYYFQGLYTQAEPLVKRALSINKKSFGAEHSRVATSLNNLAEIYRFQGFYSKAEPLYERALKIRQKVLEAEHPELAISLNNLAELYRLQGLYSVAKPLYQKALRIQEKVLGPKHLNVATSLNNLALLYYSQGLYSQAEPLFQRSLMIYENALGSEHPHIANSLNNLAEFYQAQDNLPQVHQLLSRASDIEEQNLDLMLASNSESRKRAYIATLRGTTNAKISASLIDNPESRPFVQLALNNILRRKGRVLASLTDTFQVLRKNFSPEDRPLIDRLKALRSQRATLTFQGPGPLPLDQHQIVLAKLKNEEDTLENQLARKSAAFRIKIQPVTIETIQELIPQGAVLVEFVKYKPFNSKAVKQEPKWGTPHYAAFILSSNGNVQRVKLGAAKPIDEAVTQFRHALKSEGPNIKSIARQLDQQLMVKIRAKLGSNQQLLLSPDSQLNLIPFAALVDENEKYLVENYDITYLSSGRDLLKLQSTDVNPLQHKAPVIIADPDFQKSVGSKITTAPKATNLSSLDLTLQFSPLPGTEEEGKQIHKLLPHSQLLTQDKASENALKQVQSPLILHIATHGFFLETNLESASPLIDNRARVQPLPKKWPPLHHQTDENPLLRSGLALTGANSRKHGTEDGIFTALEAAGLNLQGTQLVVLSACETGLGDIANGEGVYGLRRAFVMAGAESQILSLWKVSDVGTKDLMVKYYQRLLNKQGRGKALRQTQLEMLSSSQYSHPFYWAAFIPSGDWRSLQEN